MPRNNHGKLSKKKNNYKEKFCFFLQSIGVIVIKKLGNNQTIIDLRFDQICQVFLLPYTYMKLLLY